MRDLLIKGEWFNKIIKAPEEIQRELFYRIIRYGCLEQEIVENEDDDWGLSNAWENIKGDLDRMKVAHDANVENGKINGAKMKADPQAIYDYCQANPKAKADEVGKALGLTPKPTAAKGPYGYLYENPGWKNRKISGWKFEEESGNISSENFSNSDSKKNSDLENSSENEFQNGKDLEDFSREQVVLEKPIIPFNF